LKRSATLVGAAVTLAAAITLPAAAAPTIAVTDAWSRPATQTGGVFLTIANRGAADRLVDAASNVAAHVELHESVIVRPPGTSSANAMAGAATSKAMTMRRVRSIAIAADAATVLKPGGYHVMLIGLKQPLKSGDRVRLRLTSAHAGVISTTATVRSM